MAEPGARAAVIGFSCHTGWAAAVAVVGPCDAPSVAAKGRVTMASGKPWTMDQKEAALAAWLTLATGPLPGGEAALRSSARPRPRSAAR